VDTIRSLRPVGALLYVPLVTALLSATAAAQPTPSNYPARPVRLVVPFAPAGPTDFIARVMAGRMSDRLGQPVIIDNRPGASGNIAIQMVARAQADGHTLLFSSSNLVSNPALSAKTPFDPVRDFAPISYVAVAPNIVFVHPSVPARTVAEWVTWAKAQGSRLSYASPGTGTTPHLACEALRAAAGLQFSQVPYQGAGPAVAAVLGNQVPVGCTAIPPTVPHAKSGALRAIAVTSAKRSAILPDVPTLAESGFPGVIADNLQGLLAPAGTPVAVIRRLHEEVRAILAEPDVRERLLAAGFDLHASTPEAFARIIREETARYAKIISQAGIRTD